MPRKRLLWLGAAAVAGVGVLVLVLAGGDDAPQLTHSQVVADANAVCAGLARKNLALRPPPKPYDEQSAEFFDGVQANTDDARKRLEGLNPPSADSSALDSFTRALGEISPKLEQASAAASVGQGTEIEALIVEIRELVRTTIDAERRLGICPGRTSTRTSIAAAVKRTRQNPLTETGPLVP